MKLLSFPNLGNTCYINSVLQCFCYSQFNLFESIDLNEFNENINIVFDIKPFINYFFENNKDFKRFQQNDSHEFLIKFLELLSEKFPQVLKEYYGQTNLNITCDHCKNIKCVHEDFNTINLNVPVESSSLSTLFRDYLKKEIHNDSQNLYYCDYCKNNEVSFQKLNLSVLPNTLIIVLKRYSAIGVKILSEIICESTIYIKLDEIFEYTLKSTINHSGDLYNGHYTACNLINGEWYYFDDQVINKIETFNYSNSELYILFYQRN